MPSIVFTLSSGPNAAHHAAARFSMASVLSSATCAVASLPRMLMVLMTTAKSADRASITPIAYLALLSDVGDFITELFLSERFVSQVRATSFPARFDGRITWQSHIQSDNNT